MRRLALLLLPAVVALVPPARSAAPGDVIVNEIMKNPRAVFDSAGEWFELYNATGSPVDVNGWTIRDLNSTPNLHVISNGGPLVIPPAGYLVLGNNRNVLTNGGVTVHYQYPSSWQLGNSGDAVLLIDPAGVEVDRVQYDTTTFPNPDGSSMALRHFSLDNALGANWCQASTPYGAGDRGTPGAPNDCGEGCVNGLDDDFDGLADCEDEADCSDAIPCLEQAYVVEVPASATAECQGPGTVVLLEGRVLRGGIVVSEILVDPAAVGDSVGEWVELTNRSSEAVDVGGWRLRDFGGDSHVIAGPLVIAPGEAIVLGASTDSGVNGGAPVDQSWSGFSLGNQADQVVLVDDANALVDLVAWDQATFPIGLGGSIALRDLDVDNADGANWCLSSTPFGAGDQGTPGAPNACDVPATSPGTVVITEIMKDPSRVGDATGEWIELLNRTAAPIDIDGWTLVDDDFDAHVIDNGGPLVVPPGGRIVLGSSTDVGLNGGVAVAYRWTGYFLGNDDDEVVLLDLALDEVDRVVYDAGATFPDTVGSSLALRADDLDGEQGASWCISRGAFGAGDRGTPGAPSDCDVVVMEAPGPLAWASDCPGASFGDASAASTSLLLDPTGCETSCTATLRLDATTPQEATVDVLVSDTLAPVVSPGPPAARSLWPPDHRMECFTIADLAPEARDECGGEDVGWRIVGCASSQPVDARGDGSTDPDCEISSDRRQVCVRVERSGREPGGRSYSLMGVAVDGCGNESDSVLVAAFDVAHDQRDGARPGPTGPRRRH